MLRTFQRRFIVQLILIIDLNIENQLITRTSTAKTLTANEIIPLIGDVSHTDKIAHLIKSVPIDIVVDTTSAYESAPSLLEAVTAISKTRLQTLAYEGHSSPKLGFVYVSGTWVRPVRRSMFLFPPPFSCFLLLKSRKSSIDDVMQTRCNISQNNY